MNKNVIGADHEFHDESFAQGWADRFVPTPERISLFNLILSEIQCTVKTDSCVVELGIGPGYLANHILSAMPNINYIGIDFSQPMLAIASKRLRQYSKRLALVWADLIHDNWQSNFNQPIHAVISTWALHDLGTQGNIFTVYDKSYQALTEGGIFLNGDFIKPDKTNHAFEGGRFETGKHIEMLNKIGFINPTCIELFEIEKNNPTPAQNYACLKAIKFVLVAKQAIHI
ncbi:MAG: class I SAM-dependent methyltransferase [Gammaproteobacteria bacterium]|nr:class I SAM-dependent methyltransferase [Gammaproteobacteria bacterium]